MNERIIESCIACASANASLIKTLSQKSGVRDSRLVELTAACSLACLACVRGCEAGTCLPETLRACYNACRELIEYIQGCQLVSPTLDQCMAACERCMLACDERATSRDASGPIGKMPSWKMDASHPSMDANHSTAF